MAKTATQKAPQFTFDATAPFYAIVGAGDIALAKVRETATEVQSRFAELDRDALAGQARDEVTARVNDLVK